MLSDNQRAVDLDPANDVGAYRELSYRTHKSHELGRERHHANTRGLDVRHRHPHTVTQPVVMQHASQHRML